MRWEDESTLTLVFPDEDTCTEDILDAETRQLPARRRTTQPCPLCGMRNALSITEVMQGYLCEDCVSN